MAFQLRFCSIITSKLISRAYFVAVKPLNTPCPACLLVYKKLEDLVVSFFLSFSLQKHKIQKYLNYETQVFLQNIENIM